MPLGLNPGSLQSHKRYLEMMGFNFPLLADTKGAAAKAYGCLKGEGLSIQRSVIIVDKNGLIRYVQRGMPSNQEILEALKTF